MEDLLKNKKIRKKNKEIEIEEIFLDNSLSGEKDNFEIRDKRLEVPLTSKILYFFLVLVFLSFSSLWISCFKLQVVQGNNYKELAEKNKFASLEIQSSRGVIYDSHNNQLVWNETSFDLIIEKEDFFQDQGKSEEILERISYILDQDLTLVKEKIEKSQENLFVLGESLSYPELISLKLAINGQSGIFINQHLIRRYSDKGGLSHILGYLGKIRTSEIEDYQGYSLLDFVGREGLEKEYEEILKARKGEIKIERTAEGRELNREIAQYPESGDSLILNLDLSLQEKIGEVMERVLDEVGSEEGAIVALDPRDGGVLASLSLPYFDNNLFAQGITVEEFQSLNEDESNPQMNRVISGLYPTGSTIKPFIGSAALEEGVVTEDEEIFCPLDLCLENIYTQEKECFSDWEFHGWTDIKKAIAQSVNPFFYMIGGGYERPDFADQRLPKSFKGLGVERIKKYLNLFGFGQETGIDLPGELAGRVPDPEWKEDYFEEQWYLGDTYNMSIGQGYLLATPIQVASAFSAIANNGTLYQPRLLNKVIDSQNEVIREEDKVVVAQDFIKESNLLIIKEGMRQAVANPQGSAHSLSLLPVSAGAKTGTAQIRAEEEIYHNWITVFAPYDNPEIVLTVLIESVPGTQPAAQRTAFEILNWYFQNKEND
jgi:penicillin-binding protein 2